MAQHGHVGPDARERRVVLAREPALVAPQHNGQPPDRHILAPHNLAAARVLNVHVDERTVRNVAQTALVRRNAPVDRVGVRALGAPDRDVGVLEVELGVDVRLPSAHTHIP